MADEPMSDEQLAEIRRRTLGGSGFYPAGTDVRIVFDRHRLLAEVERLRTENAALRLDNAEGRRASGQIPQLQLELAHQDAEIERLRAREAAAMEIVRAVANGATTYRDREDEYCTQDDNCFWRRPAPGQPVQMVHTERCIVTKARALLDQEKSPLTPFAQHLREWLWSGRGYGEPAWSRHKLALELDVPDDTVEAWFVPDIPGAEQRPSYPKARVFWRLQQLTGWKPDLMALLCGYSRLPPQEE